MMANDKPERDVLGDVIADDAQNEALTDTQCLEQAADAPSTAGEKQSSADELSANGAEAVAPADSAPGKPVSRREFVAGGVAAAFLCAGGASLAYVTPSQSLLRPPGGQDEDYLGSNCLRCYRCISACPEHCLVAAKLDDGLLNMRTPTIDFTKGYCTFCDVCKDVCVTQAIKAFDPATEKIGVACVDSAKCVAYKRPGSCKRCVEACEYNAISLNGDSLPVVNADLCNGCGACEYACPSDSFTSFSEKGHRGIYVALSTEAGE